MVTAEDWRNPSHAVFDEPIIQRLTFKFALLIIGICGFGLTSLSWNDPLKASADMSTQESLKVVSETMVAAALAPKWFWKLPIGWSVQANLLGCNGRLGLNISYLQDPRNAEST
jgi:hypothetical protein